MRLLLLIFSFGLVTSSIPATAEPSEKPSMACNIGPVTKSFGKTSWLVYSCADGKSVVFVSAQGNPAFPFYFMLFPEGEDMRLYGEGTGQKSATEPAYNELKQLSAKDASELVTATKKVRVAK